MPFRIVITASRLATQSAEVTGPQSLLIAFLWLSSVLYHFWLSEPDPGELEWREPELGGAELELDWDEEQAARPASASKLMAIAAPAAFRADVMVHDHAMNNAICHTNLHAKLLCFPSLWHPGSSAPEPGLARWRLDCISRRGSNLVG